jgi:prepilin-type N-terminal cleavage/methylation domain-containing protein
MKTSFASGPLASGSVPSAPGQRGFTLIEMLVVLVLTTLVVGIVFEGLGRVADLRVRLARHLDGALDETIVGSWFRSSLAALQTDLDGAPAAFRGGPAEMSGLTLKPIELPAGAPTAFAWRLVAETASGSTRLGYRGADGVWREIAAWPATGARFLYAGPDGEWRSEWPPPLSGGSAPLGQVVSRQRPQLPRFVRLDGGTGTEARSTVTTILGTTMPKQGLTDILGAVR